MMTDNGETSRGTCQSANIPATPKDIMQDCDLYLAPSGRPEYVFGLYAGTNRDPGDIIAEPDIVLSIPDINMNEWSPWHNIAWSSVMVNGVHLENDFMHRLILPGLGSMTSCSDDVLVNALPNASSSLYKSEGVHRSKDATAGSFSYRSGYTYKAIRTIQPGQEIITPCGARFDVPYQGEMADPPSRTVQWLRENGVCVDAIAVGPSTIAGIGRGAFSKRAVNVGDVITTTPLVHFDRSQTYILEQEYRQGDLPHTRDHGIQYKFNVTHLQLLLNYAYGHPDSTVLLLPLAPGVSFINHHREKANAYVRWSTADQLYNPSHPLTQLSHFAALEQDAFNEPHQLAFDIVASRNILPGEEIFLDYGDEWVTAWEKHVAQWSPLEESRDYVSAAEYEELHFGDPIRTRDEQKQQPYPVNLRTACFFLTKSDDDYNRAIEWSEDRFDCMRHCDILNRTMDGTSYTAVVFSRRGIAESDFCPTLPEGGVKAIGLPRHAVKIIDQPYSTDVYLKGSFRHEIGVPDGLYPSDWMMTDPKSKGDFMPTRLGPGEIEPIRWADTGEIVTPNAYRLGLGPRVREVLLDYCQKMGITDIFRKVTIDGNALEPGMDTFLKLDGESWFLQRPASFWRSNLQWLSPGDNSAHEHYLQALSVAGFDYHLKRIGQHLGLRSLVAFHVTFIAVSSSSKGFMHYDVVDTGNKTFNIIVPLILANSTGPELDIQNAREIYRDKPGFRAGRYRYEYDIASMMGDDSTHGSSAVDYRLRGEMRMAATIYVADVSEENVENILADYTQAYPPRDRELLLRWAGRHWKRDDPSARLPKPAADHILVVTGSTPPDVAPESYMGDYCGLYLAPSMRSGVALALFTGVASDIGDHVGEPELIFSIPDANKNEFSPWHDFSWPSDLVQGINLENKFLHDLIPPGISSMTACPENDFVVNVLPDPTTRVVDSVGVHRSNDATAGSFSYHFGYTYKAARQIQAGEEIVMSCLVRQAQNIAEIEPNYRLSRSLDWLQKNGVCVDAISVRPSTIPGIGRGAFSKRALSIGERITTSPVVHFDRSQMLIMEQKYNHDELPFNRDHGIVYKREVKRRQLLLNYCFGHPDSTVLLLPLAPGVNFINHSRERVNAYVQWSILDRLYDTSYPLKKLSHFDLLEKHVVNDRHQLAFDIVASRSIRPGEEIFLDYGDEWVAAWEKHLDEWKTPAEYEGYVSAAEFKKEHTGETIRTSSEQINLPYPDNLRTACFFLPKASDDLSQPVEWSDDRHDCLRHCEITDRSKGDDESTVLYTATIFPRPGEAETSECGRLPDEGVSVSRLPAYAVTIVDKPYSSDVFLPNSFRHEIVLPDGFYPQNWMMSDLKPKGDFVPTHLAPNEIEPIRWADTGKIVTPNGYRLGLDARVRQVLLEYCLKMGITDIFRKVTIDDNALEPGTDVHLKLDGQKWFLQRPASHWRSNLQWFSPSDSLAHEHYLQALSAAGFDLVLQSIGEYFNLDGLVVFQVTFMAVTSSTKGFMHYDMNDTGNKAFNIIIPLILANSTGPELDLQNAPEDQKDTFEGFRAGRYRYELNVASVMGDNSIHGSSAVDYRLHDEMRMAATIYVADVNEGNVDAILRDYTQAYPPRDRDLLLSWAGRHWKRNDPSAKLPEPPSHHILSLLGEPSTTRGEELTNSEQQTPLQCGLYLAESTIPNSGLGVFSGLDKEAGETVGVGDICIPFVDMYWHNGRDFSPNPFFDYFWQGAIMGMGFETDSDDIEAYCPGLDCAVNTNPALINLEKMLPRFDDSNLHRLHDPGVGAFTPYHNGSTYVSAAVPAGGELFKYYGDSWFEYRESFFGKISFQTNFQEANELVAKMSGIMPMPAAGADNDTLFADFFKLIINVKRVFPSRTMNALPDDYKYVLSALREYNGDVGAAVYQPKSKRSIEWLNKHGRCIDHIRPGQSTIKQAGHGGFANRDLPAGTLITTSPLHHVRKTFANMYAFTFEDGEWIRHEDNIVGYQLMLNYCFNHAMSTMLFCPYGGGINYLNHDRERANVKIRWAVDFPFAHNQTVLAVEPFEYLASTSRPLLGFDYVATKDIAEGEEMFLDYGDEWIRAWQEHERNYVPYGGKSAAQHYEPARRWNEKFANSSLRTVEEQQADPYPSNLQTRCHEGLLQTNSGHRHVPFSSNDEYGLSCRILHREVRDDKQSFVYTVEVDYVDAFGDSRPTKLSDVSRESIGFFDVPTTTDLRLPNAFRHPIGIPDEMYPEKWKDILMKIKD